jgi:hypothetical protein
VVIFVVDVLRRISFIRTASSLEVLSPMFMIPSPGGIAAHDRFAVSLAGDVFWIGLGLALWDTFVVASQIVPGWVAATTLLHPATGRLLPPTSTRVLGYLEMR